jgi:inosose dehydratase
MAMLLAFSTWGMQKTPIDVAVTHCAALGYDGLELTVIPRWPTDAATMNAAERKRIRRLYDDNHIDLCGLSGNTPLLTGSAAERAANVEIFTTYLDLAAELQKPGEHLSVSTTSAGEPGSWETVKHEVAELFGKAAAYAESVGVIVGAEPHVSNALHTPDQAIWLVEQVNSPAFGIHFDISHFNVQGMDMEAAVAQLVPYTVHTHVKDERGIAPNHEFLIPGEGDMDYVGYLKAMDRAGWHEYITVEISLMVQARPDFDALAAATQSYHVLSKAFEDAGITRERG